MERSIRAASLLHPLLRQWQKLLLGWAQDGSIRRAAQEALGLRRVPPLLAELVSPWAAGDFSSLPPVELLSAAAMGGAAGAYAISTGTIYINTDWLQRARPGEVLAVLTEELGHHLDALLNSGDTPGDEGELFAALLQGHGVISTHQRQRLLLENDQGSVIVNGKVLAVEQATVVSTPIATSFPGHTRGEFRNDAAFAALRGDGSVVTWGEPSRGGDSSGVAQLLSSDVTQIFCNKYAFAALKSNGSVVAWGDASSGGNIGAVANQLSSGVTQIFSTGSAFAALKSNGSVVTWGYPSMGGDSSGVASALSSDVTQIFSTGYAFAALKSNGSVVTWGDVSFGGNSNGVASELSSGVAQIFSTFSAFAALKSNGSVVTWGLSTTGGDSSLAANGLSNVTQIFSTYGAFAALRANGSVVTWGEPSMGGDSSGVANLLSSGVTQIVATSGAFAALKSNGSVVTWGDGVIGGNSNGVASALSSDVTQIFSTDNDFAALKSNGSVVSWGAFVANVAGVAAQLNSNVSTIFSTGSAFAALKNDGSVVTWGHAGGDSSGVASQLSNVVGFANPLTDDRLVVFDPPASITLAVSPAAVTEDGSGNLIYTFSRNGLLNQDIDVNYTVSGTAILGNDYSGIAANAPINTVRFANRATSVTVVVDPTVDIVTEADETVSLSLVPGNGYTIDTMMPVVGTILDNDQVVTLSVAPGSVMEDGSSNLIYTFSRSGNGPLDRNIDVNYSVGGTAIVGNDYTVIAANAPINTVRFANRATSMTVVVDPTVDRLIEPDETVALSIVPGNGYTIGNSATATGTIINDEVHISLQSTLSVTEDGNNNLIYTFTRTGPTASELNVNYTVSGTARLVGTATDPADYTFLGNSSNETRRTLTFARGSDTATVIADPIADSRSEANETVVLTLGAGTGYTFSQTPISGAIINDDVQSSVSYVLGQNQSTLTLTGTSPIDGTGNSLDNTIIGNTANNRIAGLGGKDILTGSGGSADRDVFVFAQSSDSLLLNPLSRASNYFDEITDYNSNDRLSAAFAAMPNRLSSSLGMAASVSPISIASLLTATTFAASALAAFTASGYSGTFIAMNDGRAGFQAETDGILLLRNYSISAANFVEFV
ncbi:MAG: Calx-beta domain-containing protein [Cyanobacteriota bacterium]